MPSGSLEISRNLQAVVTRFQNGLGARVTVQDTLRDRAKVRATEEIGWGMGIVKKNRQVIVNYFHSHPTPSPPAFLSRSPPTAQGLLTTIGSSVPASSCQFPPSIPTSDPQLQPPPQPPIPPYTRPCLK